MIVWYLAFGAAILYQLFYLVHCVYSRQKTAAIGAALQTALSSALLILLFYKIF